MFFCQPQYNMFNDTVYTNSFNNQYINIVDSEHILMVYLFLINISLLICLY